MKSHLRIGCARGFVLTIVAFLAATATATPPRLEVTLEQQRIFKGESVVLNVDVLDVEPQGAPDVSGLVDFIVEPQADRSMSSSTTVIINGRMRNDRRVAHRFPYLLTPKRAGTLELPSPVYVHDGEEYRGPTLRLEVIAPSPQQWVRFGLRLERKGTRPLQPVTIRLRLFVKRLPAPNDGVDPVAGFSGESPKLSVPWGKMTPPEGLDAESIDRWLGPLRSRRERGFSINDFTFPSNDLFDVFGGARVAVFALGGRPATESDLEGFDGLDGLAGKARDYYVYELVRSLTPTRPGEFELPPVTIQGEFATGVTGRNTVTTETVFDEGMPVRFSVEDAPAAGRPISFAGAFGRRFTASASISPDRGRVGDPLSLAITVRGDGNLASMSAPDLVKQPALADSFAIERAGSEFENGVRTFQYLLRANSDAVREVPPIEFAWFDVDADSYATTRTAPLSVTIDSVSSLGSSDIVTGPGSRFAKDSIERADGLFGNRVDPSAIGDHRVDGRSVFLKIGSLAIAYALISLAMSWRERRNSDPTRVRRRGAVRRMNDRIAVAARGDGSAETLQLALLGLVADAAGVPESGLTGKEALKALAAMGVDETVRGEFTATVDEIDGSRFGGGRVDADLSERTRSLAARLASELERLGRLR